MKLSQRSYPHPVVGNSDDVPSAAFQATIDAQVDKRSVYISVQATCSSETLLHLIANDSAEYVLHIECSNTVFRATFPSAKSSFQVPIPRDNLNDLVEANVFVCAKTPILNYQVKGAHPDYEEHSFAVQTGDILAISDGYTFSIEADYEATAVVGAIMVIQPSQANDYTPASIEFNSDRIVIILAKEDYNRYKDLHTNPLVGSLLASSVVLPALMEAIRILREENIPLEDETRRWARILGRRIEQLGEAHEAPFALAQRLLESPYRRSLMATTEAVSNTAS